MLAPNSSPGIEQLFVIVEHRGAAASHHSLGVHSRHPVRRHLNNSAKPQFGRLQESGGENDSLHRIVRSAAGCQIGVKQAQCCNMIDISGLGRPL